MQVVEETERQAGRRPRRVHWMNLGYDIESSEPETGHLRFIEVKGRHAGADSIHVTRNEWLVALNQRERFALAVVLVQDGQAVGSPHYIWDPMTRLVQGDLTFGVTGIDLNLKEMLHLEQTLA